MERGVTSRYHGSKISKSQQSFLTETALCIVQRWKERMGFRLFLEWNHTQESHIWQFSSLFSVIFAEPRQIWQKIWDLEICYHGNVTSRLLISYWTTGFRQDKRRNLIIIIFFYFGYLFIYSFEGRNFGRTIVTLALTLLWMKKRKTKIMSVRICLRKKRKMTKKTFSMYGVTSHIPSTLAAVMRSLYIV